MPLPSDLVTGYQPPDAHRRRSGAVTWRPFWLWPRQIWPFCAIGITYTYQANRNS
jgi:hypothetical protein